MLLPFQSVDDVFDHCAVEPVEQGSLMALLIDFLLFLVLFVTPWLISTQFKEVFNTTKNAWIGFLAIALMVAFVLQCVVRREIVFPRTRVLACAGLFVLWMAISLIWAASFAVAIRDFGFHAALFTIFIVAVCTVTSRERIENLLHFAIASAVIVAGYATMQYWKLDEGIFMKLSSMLYDSESHRGLLTLFFSEENAAWLHSWIDPRFLVLPKKHEEPSKIYSFMGHRNYLAGYLIAVIPLVLSRLVAHLDVMFKSHGQSRSVTERNPLVYAMVIVLGLKLVQVGLIGTGGGSHILGGLFLMGVVPLNEFILRWIDGAWAKVVPAGLACAVVLAFLAPVSPSAGLLALVAVGFSVAVASLHGSARSVIVYLASFTLMFSTVLQTHTRGAWIGLAVGLPLLVLLIFFLDSKTASREVRPLLARIGVFAIALLIKANWHEQSWSWIPLGLVLVEGIARYSLYNFKPRFLDRRSLLASLVPIFVIVAVLNWKSLSFLGRTVTNPANKELVSAADRLNDTFRFRSGTSTHQRALIYLTSLSIIFDNPFNLLFGTGIGTYGLQYMPHQHRLLSSPSYSGFIADVNKSIYAHDEYLHYWSELGLIGLLILMGLTLFFLQDTLRDLRRLELDYDALLYFGIIASLMSVLGHLLFSFCLHLAYTASLFWCMVAFALRFYPKPMGRVGSVQGRVEPFNVSLVRGEVGIRSISGGRVRAWLRMILPDEIPGKDGPGTDQSLVPRLTFEGPEGPGPEEAKRRIREFSVLISGIRHRVLEITQDLGETAGRYVAVGRMDGDGEARVQLDVSARSPLLLPLAMIILVIASWLPIKGIMDVLAAEHSWRNAFLKFKLGKFEQSFPDYVKSMRLDPVKGEINFDFGRALMDSNRNEQAIRIFREATKSFVDPANYHNIALCSFKLAGLARQNKDLDAHKRWLDRTERAYREALSLNLIYEQSLSNITFLLLERATDRLEAVNGLAINAPEVQDAMRSAQDLMREAEGYALKGTVYYRWSPTFWTGLGIVRARLDEDTMKSARTPLIRALSLMMMDRAKQKSRELGLGVTNLEGDLKGLEASSDESLEKQAALMAAIERRDAFDEQVKAVNSLYWIEGREDERKVEEAWRTLETMNLGPLEPNGDKVRVHLSMVFLKAGEQQSALDVLAGIDRKTDPQSRQRFLSLLSEHYNEKIKAGKATSHDLMAYARQLTEWSMYPEAARVIYTVIDQDRGNLEAILLLADCLYKQKYLEEARQEYVRLERLLDPADSRRDLIVERRRMIDLALKERRQGTEEVGAAQSR